MLEPSRERTTTSADGADLRDADVVVFDYDGTLYEGTGFLEPYLEILRVAAGGGADDIGDLFRAVTEGAHVLSPGDLYHYEHGVVLRPDPDPPYDRFGLRVSRARHWDGSPAPLPPDVVDGHAGFDADVTYVGDRWQVINAVASALGIDPARRRDALDSIRRHMSAPGYDWGVPSDLSAVLLALGDVPERVVVTNTPRHYAQEGLARTGLASAFTRVVYDTGKPAGLLRVLAGLVREGVPPSRIVCVGDNYWNDVVPAIQSGCRSVLVDALGVGAVSAECLRVDSLHRLRRLLEERPRPGGHGQRSRQ